MVRREVLLWLRAAREDLFDAELMLEEARWFRAAWFSQQAAEKALKALFPLVAGREPPRLHSVAELARLLEREGLRFPGELAAEMVVLDKYYTVTRYPDAANGLPSETVDQREALRAVEVARRVLEFAERVVREAEAEEGEAAPGGGGGGCQAAGSA